MSTTEFTGGKSSNLVW